VVHIAAPLLASITGAAETAYPQECCGLLVGRDAPRGKRAGGSEGRLEVTAVRPSPNVTDGDPRKSFLVDARVHFELMRELGDGPERIIGHYHSHPDETARPSAHDRESVFYPDHVWVIIAVDDGRAGEVAAFAFDRDRGQFREIGLASQSGDLDP